MWARQFSRALLVVGTQDVPRRFLSIRSFEQQVAGEGVVEPPRTRQEIHWAELPLTEPIVNARFETALLFLVTGLKPF